VIICLHVVQVMPLPPPSSLASLKSRMVLHFWYRLTQAVLEKRPLNECCCCTNNTNTWLVSEIINPHLSLDLEQRCMASHQYHNTENIYDLPRYPSTPSIHQAAITTIFTYSIQSKTYMQKTGMKGLQYNDKPTLTSKKM